jgi:nicotinamide-nucleotide amidase
MKLMFDDTVAPRIAAQGVGATRIRHRVLKFFGTGESDMEQRLGEMIARTRQPRVGITVSAATISLRITAIGPSDEVCETMIDQTRAEILRLVPEYYFGEGEEFEQQHAIEASLRQRGQSLFVIELGRAAPLGDWFASLGPTPAYRGGLSLPNGDDLLAMFGPADGEPTVSAALHRAQAKLRVDWILLVDSYPLLDKSSDQPQAASEVRFVVLAADGSQRASRAVIGGHPEVLQPRIAKTALAHLRRIVDQPRTEDQG